MLKITCRIAEHLPNLQGLDLSDTALAGENASLATVQVQVQEQICEEFHVNSSVLVDNATVRQLLSRITLLGLPDPGRLGNNAAHIAWRLLPMCSHLKTLSIRGTYVEQTGQDLLDDAHYVCRFIDQVVTNLPSTVTSLELRLKFPYFESLGQELKRQNLNIHSIGIDFGAWVHSYSLRDTSSELEEDQVRKATSAAAHKKRYELYEEEHNKVFPEASKWWLPLSTCENERNSVDRVMAGQDGPHPSSRSFYHDGSGSNMRYATRGFSVVESSCPLDNGPGHQVDTRRLIDDTKSSTLSSMLHSLYRTSQSLRSGSRSIDLFPL